MADSVRNYKDFRGLSPIAGSDPPDDLTSRVGWTPTPRQTAIEIFADVVVVHATESRQAQNDARDNVVHLRAIDVHAYAHAIVCDSLNRIPLQDALRADMVARGFRMQPHDGALIIRAFNTRLAEISETLRRYEGVA